MQTALPRVTVFPIITKANPSSPTIILSKTETGIKPIQGLINPVDPSCIYTATRLFLKSIYEQEFQDSNVTINSSLNLWFDETFKHWLGRFVEADFYDNEDEKSYLFILPIDEDIKEISSDKVIQVTEEECKNYASEEYSLYQQARKFYTDAERQGLIKIFGVLNCDISKNWNNHYEALYSGIFRQKGERWIKYSASKLILPSDEELSRFKGLVVSGADHESYDESVPFHDQLYKFFQKINSSYPEVKLLGVCFGCQILAHCLGGKASRMQGLDRPFIAGLENIKAKPELKEKGYYQQTVRQLNLQSDEFVAVEAHGDHVEKLPEKAVILGSSNSTNIEMWGLEDRILCVQFHPEFNAAVMKYKVIEGNEVNDEAKKSLVKNFEDSEQVYTLNRTIPVTLCKNFLKYQA